ncbi:MAG: NAD(P)-dependent oxidoreductase [Hamadaea sp.]|nr:NAD(P)-dependent oxidoreductase [Hamadaea sp.]
METVLLTGGTGGIAGFLRPRLARPGRRLRILDIRPPADVTAAEEAVIGSVTDADVIMTAMRGVDAVVHLGGRSRESDALDVLQVNVYGTYRVLDAAHRCGVRRVILASSNHAVGYASRGADPLAGDAPARPDSLYGWSKAAIEACGRLYADQFGLDVLCLRIGSCFAEPFDLRSLALWLSPDDCARLIEACLTVERPGFRIVWGISRNTRRWCSLAEGEAIGYFPEDDAETYAAALVERFGEPDWGGDPILNRVGGGWCAAPLGIPF